MALVGISTQLLVRHQEYRLYLRWSGLRCRLLLWLLAADSAMVHVLVQVLQVGRYGVWFGEETKMAGKDTESVSSEMHVHSFCFAVCFDFVLCILHHYCIQLNGNCGSAYHLA